MLRPNRQRLRESQQIVQEHSIDCDFRRTDAYTYAKLEEEELDKVKAEVEASKRLGLPASFVESTPLPFPVKGR
jgi:hypothetical protein